MACHVIEKRDAVEVQLKVRLVHQWLSSTRQTSDVASHIQVSMGGTLRVGVVVGIWCRQGGVILTHLQLVPRPSHGSSIASRSCQFYLRIQRQRTYSCSDALLGLREVDELADGCPLSRIVSRHWQLLYVRDMVRVLDERLGV